MVLFVMKWDIHPDKADEYAKWTQTAIQRTFAAGGSKVVEFRGYRPSTGDSQVAITYEFSNMVDWANWQEDEESQNVLSELHKVAMNVKLELWGPSPIVPEPIRPGG
jgi:hypothetical protein